MSRLTVQEANDVCRLLEMITRLGPSSYPSALDQATALALYRKLRSP